MALTKTGFKDAVVGTASFRVETTTGGNIAVGSDIVTGYKRISFNTVNAEATKTGAEAVANVFLKVLPGDDAAGEYDGNNTTFTVKWEVA